MRSRNKIWDICRLWKGSPPCKKSTIGQLLKKESLMSPLPLKEIGPPNCHFITMTTRTPLGWFQTTNTFLFVWKVRLGIRRLHCHKSPVVCIPSLRVTPGYNIKASVQNPDIRRAPTYSTSLRGAWMRPHTVIIMGQWRSSRYSAGGPKTRKLLAKYIFTLE